MILFLFLIRFRNNSSLRLYVHLSVYFLRIFIMKNKLYKG